MLILEMCFVIAQVVRIVTGSTTEALTTAAIVSTAASVSGVSPILCAGLSLPIDSGFWAISRFFHLNEVDTIQGWTPGGLVAGVTILVFACVLSLFQGFLPGLI